MKMQYTFAVFEKWNLKESKNEMGNYVWPRPSTKERSYGKKKVFVHFALFLMTFAAIFFQNSGSILYRYNT